MSEEDDKYREEMKAAGVDLPELNEEKEPEKEPKPEVKEDPEKKEDVEEKSKIDPENKDEVPPPQRKRSIYDDLKEKKLEVRTEKDLRLKAEAERDEWKQKAEAVAEAKTPEEKKEAQDDLEAFAKEIDADPATVRKMRDLFLKDLKPSGLTDDERKDLEDFKAFKSSNAKEIERNLFEQEFQKVTPVLKEMFPTATEAELEAVKKEIDTISHTKDWHDKDLDYIAFKHKDKLSPLVSPKKKGMESKERKETEGKAFEFDPNADYSKMSLPEREKWEQAYREATRSDGLATDDKGRKILI